MKYTWRGRGIHSAVSGVQDSQDSSFKLISRDGTLDSIDIGYYWFSWILSVAVNYQNDKYFENGLVMGSAYCKYYAGLVETPKSCFKRKPGPLSDTLQAGACVFPDF